MKSKKSKFSIRSNRGFLTADFLFAFVMSVGVGIFIFALTFSLATIEVAQYIVWTSARHYSAGYTTRDEAAAQAKIKFEKVAGLFPLLTGVNESNNTGWFELSPDDVIISDKIHEADPEFRISNDDANNDYRQPWTGVSAKLSLKLFSGLQVPFIGRVDPSGQGFNFPVRAFLIRQVSEYECTQFFVGGGASGNRIENGIKLLENGNLAKDTWGLSGAGAFVPRNSGGILPGEDNGC